MNYEVYVPKQAEAATISKPITFSNGIYNVFEYSSPKADEDGFILLPQVPYEIKEHALKGVLYTFFLTLIGRIVASNNTNFFSYALYSYFPAGVFLYQYGKSLWYMYNAIIKVDLIEGGEKVRLHFKYQPSFEVKINQILKKKEENFLVECFTEPFLYPIQINFTELYGKFSLRSHRIYYLYGDKHNNIKNGEILRAIINGQNIVV